MNDDPVRRSVTIHHDDASIEYVLCGPTEGSLLGPIRRIQMSFLKSDVVVSRPAMVRGEVQVSVRVFR